MTDIEEVWIETWMQKLVAATVFLFIVGMLIARYYNWFGFGGA